MADGVGDFFDDRHQMQSESLALGIQYAQGSEARGLRGPAAAALAEKWGHPLNGIDLRCVPPSLRCPEVYELFSRILEKTFRDISLTARPSSHVAPPFASLYGGRIHKIATGVAIGVNYLPVISFQTDVDLRGVIHKMGLLAESAAALADIQFQILIGGNAIDPYNDFPAFAFPWSPMETFDVPLALGPMSTTVTLQAKSVSGAAHTLAAQLTGWTYQTRTEVGNNVKSTIVD